LKGVRRRGQEDRQEMKGFHDDGTVPIMKKVDGRPKKKTLRISWNDGSMGRWVDGVEVNEKIACQIPVEGDLDVRNPDFFLFSLKIS
jgi:hypothetical protein